MLLQTQIPQAGDIRELSSAAVELAEATANYGALKVTFSVFMVVVLFLIVYFIIQHTFLLKNIKQLVESSNLTLKYFNALSNKTVGKSEAKAMMRTVVNNMSILTKYTIIRIRLENHISEEELTKNKITQVINNMYAENISYLNQFLLSEEPIGVFLNYKDDVSVINKMVKEWVYMNQEKFSISSMDQAVELFFGGLKISYTDKIEKE